MAAPSSPSGSLTLSFSREYENVPSVRPIEAMYLTASIEAPLHESEERASRVPLDLCCCIDKSGSMDGKPLEMVKETMKFVVQQLKPADRLSIVSFDAKALVDFKLTFMDAEGKKKAIAAINAVKSGAGTNLSGGLLTALELLRTRSDVESRDVCSLLLLTDGEPTKGIRDPEGIISACDTALSQASSPITVSTFGFGQHHDSNMLRQIAEKCGGMYNYLATKEEIAPAFGDVLGGLLSCVAQAIRLTLRSIAPVQLIKAHTGYKVESVENGQTVTIALPDIYSEERKDILFSIRLPAIDTENLDMHCINAELRYVNVATPGLGNLDAVASIPRPGGDSIELPRVNKDIALQRARIETAEALETANRLARGGELEKARAAISAQIERMVSDVLFTEVQDSGLFISLVQDLDHSLSNLRSQQQYRSHGAHQMSTMSAATYQQRSTPSKSKSAAHYSTPARTLMREAASSAMEDFE